MTDNELMKALELCPIDDDNCDQCPLYYTETSGVCLVHICTSALALIKSQQDHIRQLKSDIEKIKAEVAKKICCEIEEEIVAAIKCNYREISHHMNKYPQGYDAEFMGALRGKIDAIRGIEDFVEEIKNKYTEVHHGNERTD